MITIFGRDRDVVQEETLFSVCYLDADACAFEWVF